MEPYWSTGSMVLYVIMGLISMSAVCYIKKREYAQGKIQGIGNRAVIAWILIWEFVTIFRKVDYGLGGSDAIQYVLYFKDCLKPNLHTLYAEHLDVGFQLLTKAIRFFTSDYRVYFALIYGIIIIAYIVFINEFAPVNVYYEPMVLIFFVYLRGFNTIRTNISVAFLLLALVALYQSKKIWSCVWLILCLGMHIASFLYVPFFAFYFLYKNKKLKTWQWITLYGAVIIGARFVQQILSKMTNLRGAYAYYATVNMNASFFDNGWKIAFGQLLLLAVFVIFQKPINKCVSNYTETNRKRYQYVYLMCVYDFLMIPVNFILGIWRGYEYFYIPRMILWGIVLKTISNHLALSSRKIFRIVSLTLFIAWMIFRVYRTYEDSLLMPYIFDFFGQ